MADTGNTSTISFGTSGFTANLHVIGEVEYERPKIDTSHLATTNFETVVSSDLLSRTPLEGDV